MTPEMLGATIRALMQMASGYAIAAGMTNDTYGAVVGGAVALGTWAWSVMQKRNATKALEAAKAAPAVK
jgi:hypothetical protein